MARKKYDNNSRFFKDWTTKKLKEEALGYYQTIYVIECYGTKDMLNYHGILTELERRGVEYRFELTF